MSDVLWIINSAETCGIRIPPGGRKSWKRGTAAVLNEAAVQLRARGHRAAAAILEIWAYEGCEECPVIGHTLATTERD